MSPQTKGEDLNSLVDQRGESGRFMGGEDKIYQKAVQNKKRKLEKKQERKINSTASHCNLDHNVNNFGGESLEKEPKDEEYHRKTTNRRDTQSNYVSEPSEPQI